MRPEQQQIKIAEACGLKQPPGGVIGAQWMYPDYLNDLNAMHEAEKVLTDEQCRQFACELCAVTKSLSKGIGPAFYIWHASAVQRAEAFLKTLNYWTE